MGTPQDAPRRRKQKLRRAKQEQERLLLKLEEQNKSTDKQSEGAVKSA